MERASSITPRYTVFRRKTSVPPKDQRNFKGPMYFQKTNLFSKDQRNSKDQRILKGPMKLNRAPSDSELAGMLPVQADDSGNART